MKEDGEEERDAILRMKGVLKDGSPWRDRLWNRLWNYLATSLELATVRGGEGGRWRSRFQEKLFYESLLDAGGTDVGSDWG